MSETSSTDAARAAFRRSEGLRQIAMIVQRFGFTLSELATTLPATPAPAAPATAPTVPGGAHG